MLMSCANTSPFYNQSEVNPKRNVDGRIIMRVKYIIFNSIRVNILDENQHEV